MGSVEVIRKLRDSLNNLEKSVGTAKSALCKQDVISTDILKRVINYEEVITKQKGLVDKLIVMLDRGNANEAVRLIKVINGFSAMIFEDANDLVKTMSGEEDASDSAEATREKIYM